MNRALRRFLAVGTFWKILLANTAIVVAALLVLGLLPARGAALPSLVVAGAVVLAGGLNALVLRLALRPLTELEATAERVAAGDLGARAALSPLADRPLTELTRTFNRMIESVEAQRARARAVASRTLLTSDQASRRVSRDLRDEATQTLTVAMLRLRTLRTSTDEAARQEALDDLRLALTSVIEQLRAAAGELHPSALDLLGVDQAIVAYGEAACAAAGIRLLAKREAVRGALSPEADVALLRAAQEAIDVAISRANEWVRVSVRREPYGVFVHIEDDGDTPAPAVSEDPGLFAAREHASYFGGDVTNLPREGGGRAIGIEFPFNPTT